MTHILKFNKLTYEMTHILKFNKLTYEMITSLRSYKYVSAFFKQIQMNPISALPQQTWHAECSSPRPLECTV